MEVDVERPEEDEEGEETGYTSSDLFPSISRHPFPEDLDLMEMDVERPDDDEEEPPLDETEEVRELFAVHFF